MKCTRTLESKDLRFVSKLFNCSSYSIRSAERYNFTIQRIISAGVDLSGQEAYGQLIGKQSSLLVFRQNMWTVVSLQLTARSWQNRMCSMLFIGHKWHRHFIKKIFANFVSFGNIFNTWPSFHACLGYLQSNDEPVRTLNSYAAQGLNVNVYHRTWLSFISV